MQRVDAVLTPVVNRRDRIRNVITRRFNAPASVTLRLDYDLTRLSDIVAAIVVGRGLTVVEKALSLSLSLSLSRARARMIELECVSSATLHAG